MKKYILILFCTTLFFSSCNLDLKPESELTYNGFWDTEEAAKAAQIGIYSKYRDYNSTLWQMGEVRSDIWGGITIETPSSEDLIKNNISSTVVHFSNWANFYGLLHYVNDFLKNAPNVTFKSETEKNHMLGQVYGIRAQIYYTLVKAYGDVPINTDPLLEVDLLKLKKKRSPKAEVMALIKSDIAKSLEYFGTNNTLWVNKKIYWSKAATLALKGDVYLWSGKVLGGGNADFTEAKNALNSITGFELVSYDKLWGQANENNNEFIFAFDYQLDQASNFYGANTTGRAVDIRQYWNEKGEKMDKFVVNGANRYGPSDKTLTLLDDPKDARYGTFIRIYNDGVAHPVYTPNDKTYLSSILVKFLGDVAADGIRKDFNNIPLYRYADVLLMLAEAKNQLGEDPSNEINLVRKRAYGANYSPAYTYTNSSKTANAKAILDERYKEFIGEGKRWWDLVRAGDNFVFNEVTKLSASEAYKIYYSISSTMIANDPELTQTTGY